VDEHWIGGGFTCSGAGSLQWLADLLGVRRDPAAYDALLAEAADVPPGCRGVIFLPYLAGRGTPQANAALRGGFIHLGLEHGRAEMARAVLEGIALAVREIYQEFARLGLKAGPIRITGGGARSGLWRQIIADVLDRPVTRAGGDSTLGGAMVVAVGLGLYPDFSSAARAMVSELAHEQPDPAGVSVYERIFEVFAEARDILLNVPRFHAAG
jgi:xylulokinase